MLASQGKLQIEVVIALAAAGAIVGDNIGYLIGRKGGRWLLERPGASTASACRCSRSGEPFFERHGPKAVFFGRFVLGLRVWASWLAGATRMPWRSFLLWNALRRDLLGDARSGCSRYFLGHSAGNAIEAFGLYGLAALLIAVGGAVLAHRRHRRHAAAAAATPDSGRRAAAIQPAGPRPAPGGRHTARLGGLQPRAAQALMALRLWPSRRGARHVLGHWIAGSQARLPESWSQAIRRAWTHCPWTLRPL